MRPRDTRKSPAPRASKGFRDPLPSALPLQEAAALADTTPEELWQHIRAGRIRYTLISGERGQGTSVLVATEDLIRIGLVRGRTKARLSPRAPQPPVRPQKRAERPSRIGARAGLAMAAALGLLLFVATVPSPAPTSASRTIVRAASRSMVPSCKPGSKKKACKGDSASRSGKSKTPQGAVAGSSHSPQPRQSNPSPQGGYDVPRGIPSNCSRDVTADLLAWFKRVPNNSTLNFKSGGCYRINGSLVVRERTGLTFNGNGATFNGKLNKDPKARHWSLQHSSRIILRSMTVRGANPDAGAKDGGYHRRNEYQAAFGVLGSNDILIDNVQAYDLYGDFVHIAPMWVRQKPVTVKGLTVQNSHFDRSGRHGISIIGGEGILIQDNYLAGVPIDLVDMEPSFPTLPIRNFRFIRNRTGPVRMVWFANHGKCNTGVSNITISDNVMEVRPNNAYPAIWVKPPERCAPRGPFTVERNTFMVRQPRAALLLDRTHDVLLRGNKVRFEFAGPGDRTRVLVELTKSTRVRVLANSVRADPRDRVVFVTHDGESDYLSSGNKRSDTRPPSGLHWRLA